jgi:hypothetical protein
MLEKLDALHNRWLCSIKSDNEDRQGYGLMSTRCESIRLSSQLAAATLLEGEL